MMPKRIQRKRTKGWRMPEGAVYVGRPSKWGNPFAIERVTSCNVSLDLASQWRNAEHWHTIWPNGGHWCFETAALAAERAVELYDLHLGPFGNFETDQADIRAALWGKDLACWCPLDQPCHADVLLEIANEGD